MAWEWQVRHASSLLLVLSPPHTGRCVAEPLELNCCPFRAPCSPPLLQQDAFVFVLGFLLGFAFPRRGLFSWAGGSRGSPCWGSSGCRSIHLLSTRCWLLSLQTGEQQMNLLVELFQTDIKWTFTPSYCERLIHAYISFLTFWPIIFHENVIIQSSSEMTVFSLLMFANSFKMH